MHSQQGRSALFLVLLLIAACGGSPTAPERLVPPAALTPPPPTPPAPPSPSLASALIGYWEGMSTVESIAGVPECVAPFWRPGVTDTISVDIQPLAAVSGWFPGSNLNLHLRQQASEEAHLQVGGSESLITATNWPFDEFDCALVPALCGLQDHFRLKSSEWGCPGTPPEVWILQTNLTAAFVDVSQRRLQGMVEITYDHRPGDSGGVYRRATVVKRFDIEKSSR